jgi:hypothetical protein
MAFGPILFIVKQRKMKLRVKLTSGVWNGLRRGGVSG